MSEKSAAYNAGMTNRSEDKKGPNPYAEESKDWYEFELGWGEGVVGWRPISQYHRNGRLVKLFIPETHFSLKDETGTVTIGFNNQYNDGEDLWQHMGWCWSHDHLVSRHEVPTHFMEFDDTPPEEILNIISKQETFWTSDIAKKLTCSAMIFYEYKADDGAILTEAADEIIRLKELLANANRLLTPAMFSANWLVAGLIGFIIGVIL